MAIANAYPLLLGPTDNVAILVNLLFTFFTFSIFVVLVSLLRIAIGKSTKKLSGFCCYTVDSAGVDLDTAVQCATRSLEIDAVTLFEEGHVVKVVDQGEVPRIGGVDLVVGRHLHPFLKVGKDRHALHGCDTASSHGEVIVVVVVVPAEPRVARIRAGRRIFGPVLQPEGAFLRRSSGGLQLVDLLLVEGLARVQAALLFLGVVVQRDPAGVAGIVSDWERRGCGFSCYRPRGLRWATGVNKWVEGSGAAQDDEPDAGAGGAGRGLCAGMGTGSLCDARHFAVQCMCRSSSVS